MSEVARSAGFSTGHEGVGSAQDRTMPVELSLIKFCSEWRNHRARGNDAVGPIRVSSYKPPRSLSASFLLVLFFVYCFQIDRGDRVSIKCARVITIKKKRNSRIKVPRQYVNEI